MQCSFSFFFFSTFLCSPTMFFFFFFYGRELSIETKINEKIVTLHYRHLNFLLKGLQYYIQRSREIIFYPTLKHKEYGKVLENKNIYLRGERERQHKTTLQNNPKWVVTFQLQLKLISCSRINSQRVLLADGSPPYGGSAAQTFHILASPFLQRHVIMCLQSEKGESMVRGEGIHIFLKFLTWK